ncbi:uncharacterized protein [Zea mays]|uniref:uncharacterized protein isoform X3 n=1 Tax=Zea mays TaxID=4577 RepID=UPI0004DEA2B6|nr:uncharacterized protein LOC100217147 isoform X3 [Zea mays]|eukprot:XP_008658183.1 uncharacterized protein LOC100217147 isoform X3 [Zea mays]
MALYINRNRLAPLSTRAWILLAPRLPPTAESATRALRSSSSGRGRQEEEEMAGRDGAKSSASMEEEACGEKKYGGIAPKKKPLISKVADDVWTKEHECLARLLEALMITPTHSRRSCVCAVRMQDHERAYFDSADWVLGKQAANSSTRATVESLKPKLKRTPHHQLPPRKPTCASG